MMNLALIQDDKPQPRNDYSAVVTPTPPDAAYKWVDGNRVIDWHSSLDLRQWVFDGVQKLPMAEVARRMGVSKNVVVGLKHRFFGSASFPSTHYSTDNNRNTIRRTRLKATTPDRLAMILVMARENIDLPTITQRVNTLPCDVPMVAEHVKFHIRHFIKDGHLKTPYTFPPRAVARVVVSPSPVIVDIPETSEVRTESAESFLDVSAASEVITEPVVEVVVSPAPEPEPVKIIRLRAPAYKPPSVIGPVRTCLYVDGNGRNMVMCEEKTVPGSRWCQAHVSIATSGRKKAS
jgi:hypothetical protein